VVCPVRYDGRVATTVVHELPALRDRTRVFRDRVHAGEVLAEMLAAYRGGDAIVLAVPSGGVPVAAGIARRLGLPLDVAVVSKILLPWTTEAGFGAVAFDGTVWVDEDAVASFGLDPADVARSTAAAREKVARRVARLRGDRPPSPLAGRPALLVDDGIAAGSTMRTAIGALRAGGATEVIVAVPTGHARALGIVAGLADAVYCPNVRAGFRFAVADAYERWRDVTEDEAATLLAAAR
jgi:predicted phosphoribosyltransferase